MSRKTTVTEKQIAAIQQITDFMYDTNKEVYYYLKKKNI